MRLPLLPFFLPLLAGCTAIGPDYQRPASVAPARWSEAVPPNSTAVPSGSTTATPDSAWWKSFGDPELDSLIDRAVRANHNVLLARARVQEARAQHGLAEADAGPTVDASGGYERLRTSRHQPVLGSLPVPSDVPFDNNVYQAGFDASWEIDVFGGKRREEEAAAADLAAAVSGQRAALVTLLGDVARAYVDLRTSQRRLAIAAENTAIQEQSLGIVRDRVAHGLSGGLDSAQAEALLATTRALVPQLESQQHIALHRLGVLLGLSPDALHDELVAVQPIPTAPPSVPVGLPSTLLLRRPDIQLAERRLAAATARIGVAKADLFPRFFLTGSVGVQSIDTGNLFTEDSTLWSIGPSIRWRIFDSGRVRSAIRVQEAKRDQAHLAYEQTVLGACEEVENALVSYAKEQTRRQSLADAVTASRTALDLAGTLYANGVKDFLVVLDAQRSLHQAEESLVASDRAVTTDLIALYKALGGGWEGSEPATPPLAQAEH